MYNDKVKSHKTGTIVTYVIVLVALLAGFFIPLSFKFEDATTTMLAWQLPDMLARAFNMEIEAGSTFTLSYMFGSTEIDLAAWLGLLYALFTVLALFFLIPVLAGSRAKRTSLNSAFVVELLAMTSIVLLSLLDITNFVNGATEEIAYMLLIVLAVLVVMAFIQRVMANGGSGVIKFILVILSAAAALCALFPLNEIITSIEASTLEIGGMGSGIIGGTTLSGMLTALVTGELLTEGAMGILNIFLAILGIMVVVNLVLDIWGLCKKPNMFMHVCNQIRFLITLIAEIVIIIMAYTIDECEEGMGFMLVVVTCITVVEYVIDLIRVIMHSRKKKGSTDVAEYQYFSETIEKSEEKKARKEREKAAKKAAAEKEERDKQDRIAREEAAKQAAKDEKQNKKNKKKDKRQDKKVAASKEPLSQEEGYASVREEDKAVYNGPTDDFIDKLSDKEKMEFWTVFLKREEGALTTIPEYRLGENNTKFFTTAVIYYSKLRGLVSDGLMDKIYEENKFI